MKNSIIISLFFSCLTSSLSAQDLFTTALSDSIVSDPKTEFNGYVRAVGFGAGPQYEYGSVFGEMALKPRLSYGKTYLFADARLRSGYFFNEVKTDVELKEAYVGFNGKNLDVFLGNQIVIWGKTDGYNPTNNISPNDYFFLSDDPDDQRSSNFLLRTKIQVTAQTELDLILIPIYKSSKYRYELFDLGEGVSFQSFMQPNIGFKNGSLAARLNYEGAGAGCSISVFRGYDPFYGFSLVNSSVYPELSIVYAPKPYKKTTIGADFSAPAGDWIFRGEAACNIIRENDADISVPNSSLNWVLAAEHDFWGITAILQYIGVYTRDFRELVVPQIDNPSDPQAQLEYAMNMISYNSELYNRKIFNQQEESNHAIFLSLSKSLAHETISIKFSGLYNITSGDYLIRPDMKWKLTDALSVSLGANIMNGPKDYIFYKAGRVLNGGYTSFNVNF